MQFTPEQLTAFLKWVPAPGFEKSPSRHPDSGRYDKLKAGLASSSKMETTIDSDGGHLNYLGFYFCSPDVRPKRERLGDYDYLEIPVIALFVSLCAPITMCGVTCISVYKNGHSSGGFYPADLDKEIPAGLNDIYGHVRSVLAEEEVYLLTRSELEIDLPEQFRDFESFNCVGGVTATPRILYDLIFQLND